MYITVLMLAPDLRISRKNAGEEPRPQGAGKNTPRWEQEPWVFPGFSHGGEHWAGSADWGAFQAAKGATVFKLLTLRHT